MEVGAMRFGFLLHPTRAQTIEIRKNKMGTLLLTGADVDSATLIYQVATQPAHGTLTGTAPNLIYTQTMSISTQYLPIDLFYISFIINDV